MAIITKQALPSVYADEGKKYSELFYKGNTRTTSGNLVFTSATSVVAYNTSTSYGAIYANQGETGLMNMLKIQVLSGYLLDDTWTASVSNTIIDNNKFITATGTANAIAVDTYGTFDLTLDGNILRFKAILTNTGAITVNPDSQGAIAVKKFDIGTDLYIDLEADDIPKNGNVELRRDLGQGFFVLAPKGGVLKSYYGEGIDGALNTVGNLTLTSTLNGEAIIKKYTSINVNAGHTLTVSNPNQGLVLYSEGDVTINGVIDMSKKGGSVPNGNVIPMIITNFKTTDPNGMEFYNQLNTILQFHKGGIGGNGGIGGGPGGSNSSGGIGGSGRINLGGFGGGGGSGCAYDNATYQIGATGGSVTFADLCGNGANGIPLWGENALGFWGGNAGANGGGAGGAVTRRGLGGSYGGTCNGGGGGGGGGTGYNSVGGAGGAGEYSGGFVLIISKGNITIGATGVISCNGGNGGNGGAGGTDTIYAGGGGAGGGAGGGVVSIFHKGSYTNTGSIAVSGGLGGTGGIGNVGNGGAGTSGSVGTISIQQL